MWWLISAFVILNVDKTSQTLILSEEMPFELATSDTSTIYFDGLFNSFNVIIKNDSIVSLETAYIDDVIYNNDKSFIREKRTYTYNNIKWLILIDKRYYVYKYYLPETIKIINK